MEQQVRERAYQIWIEAGMASGHERDHWVAAERDIAVALSAKPTASKRATASKEPATNKAVTARARTKSSVKKTAEKIAKIETVTNTKGRTRETTLVAAGAKTSKAPKPTMSDARGSMN